MFATYTSIVDVAEAVLLRRELPEDVPAHRRLVEREVFYFGHVARGAVKVDMHLRNLPCAPDAHGADARVVSVAGLESTCELYDVRDGSLVTCARTVKRFVLPDSLSERVSDFRWPPATPAVT